GGRRDLVRRDRDRSLEQPAIARVVGDALVAEPKHEQPLRETERDADVLAAVAPEHDRLAVLPPRPLAEAAVAVRDGVPEVAAGPRERRQRQDLRGAARPSSPGEPGPDERIASGPGREHPLVAEARLIGALPRLRDSRVPRFERRSVSVAQLRE